MANTNIISTGDSPGFGDIPNTYNIAKKIPKLYSHIQDLNISKNPLAASQTTRKLIDAMQAFSRLAVIGNNILTVGNHVITVITYATPLVKPIFDSLTTSIGNLISECTTLLNTTNMTDIINMTTSTIANSGNYSSTDIPQLNQTEVALLQGVADGNISSSPDLVDAITKLATLASIAFIVLESRKTTLAENESSLFKKEMDINPTLNILKRTKKTRFDKAKALHNTLTKINNYHKTENISEYVGGNAAKDFEKSSHLYTISLKDLNKMSPEQLKTYVKEGGGLLKMIAAQLDKSALVHNETNKLNAFNLFSKLSSLGSAVKIPYLSAGMDLLKTAVPMIGSKVRENINTTFISSNKSSMGVIESVKETVKEIAKPIFSTIGSFFGRK